MRCWTRQLTPQAERSLKRVIEWFTENSLLKEDVENVEGIQSEISEIKRFYNSGLAQEEIDPNNDFTFNYTPSNPKVENEKEYPLYCVVSLRDKTKKLEKPYQASFVYNADVGVMQELVNFFNVKEKSSDVKNTNYNGAPFVGVWGSGDDTEVEISFNFKDFVSAVTFGFVFCQDSVAVPPKGNLLFNREGGKYIDKLIKNNAPILKYINPRKYYSTYIEIGRASNNRAILELLRDKKVTSELKECLIINNNQTLDDVINGILSIIKK